MHTYVRTNIHTYAYTCAVNCFTSTHSDAHAHTHTHTYTYMRSKLFHINPFGREEDTKVRPHVKSPDDPYGVESPNVRMQQHKYKWDERTCVGEDCPEVCMYLCVCVCVYIYIYILYVCIVWMYAAAQVIIGTRRPVWVKTELRYVRNEMTCMYLCVYIYIYIYHHGAAQSYMNAYMYINNRK
jgi:hypothetical protein